MIVWLGLLLFKFNNGTFSTNRLYRAVEYEIYQVWPGNKKNIQLNSETINKPRKS